MMKRTLILFSLLVGFLISCTGDAKQKTTPKNTDKALSNLESVKTEAVDTPKVFVAVNFVSSKKIAATKALQKLMVGKIVSVENVDFTGDKIPDYICKTKTDTTGMGDEYWISSGYQILKKLRYTTDGFAYHWFINLDNDPEPEMFEVYGDEDYADYSIADQNLKTGKDTTILYINPVILEKGKKYWGYPWDIVNIKARTNGVTTELFCSLHHQITREDRDENEPDPQKLMPVLFFSGYPTQESHPGKITNEQWLTLQAIIAECKK